MFHDVKTASLLRWVYFSHGTHVASFESTIERWFGAVCVMPFLLLGLCLTLCEFVPFTVNCEKSNVST